MDYRQFIEVAINSKLIFEPLELSDEVANKIVENAYVRNVPGHVFPQIINVALSCLQVGESYCRIGPIASGKGSSMELLGELLGHSSQIVHLVGTDITSNQNQSKYSQGLEKLIESLAEEGFDEQLYLYDQSIEQFFEAVRIEPESFKVGVYYYCGDSDYRSTLLALLSVRPFLTEQALLLVGNLNNSMTTQAVRDFMDLYSQSHLQLIVLPHTEPEIGSWQGCYILGWDANPNWAQSNLSSHLILRSQPVADAIIQSNQMLEKAKPKWSEQFNREALRLYVSKQYPQAIERYTQALQLDQYNYRLWHNLALTYYDTQELDLALVAIHRSLQLNPLTAVSYCTLGSILEQRGEDEEAILAYKQAIELQPDYPKSYSNLGHIYYRLGNDDLALETYEQQANLDPYFNHVYRNIGDILLQQNQYAKAIKAYTTSLEFEAGDVQTLYRLGLAYQEQGNLASAFFNFGLSSHYQNDYLKAVKYLSRYLELAEKEVKAYCHLAVSYYKLQQFDRALDVCWQGIQKHQNDQEIYFVTGLILQESCLNLELKRLKSIAQEQFSNHASVELKLLMFLPLVYDSQEEIESSHLDLLHSLRRIESLLQCDQQLAEAYASLSYTTSFYASYQGKNDVEIQQKLGSIFHKIMERQYPEQVKPMAMLPLSKGSKIRVGYVSNCMQNHTIGYMILGWLQNHNRDDFEVYSYYINDCVDSMTQKFQLYSDVFHQLPDDLDSICQTIISDQLHLLVFTDMGMKPMSVQLASLRLAPIQCKFWGPPVTSGLPTIDYFLTSELMEAEHGEQHYSESLIRLPNIAVSYPKPTLAQPLKNKTAFGLDRQRTAYLSCQTPSKYLPQRDYIYPAIAQKFPDVQFVFISRRSQQVTDKFTQRLTRIFKTFSLAFEDYCIVTPYLSSEDFLQLNSLCDVCLDTFDWSGGKTTLEALAFGVPVVTCPGEFLRGRHAYGILRMLQVTETIANSEAEYIEIAVRLGLDLAWRQEISEKIRQNHALLYNDLECVRGLESFYQQVVQENLNQAKN
jgi:predicted O-linked N-acetylglucosamine transferase (SPINDLY family)